MIAMPKGTKIKGNTKDYMLRVRLDVETLEKLDDVCKRHNLSRSEAVRNGIDRMYQEK